MRYINIMIIASLCRMHSDACVIMLQVLVDRLAGTHIKHENLLRVPELLCAPELACPQILLVQYIPPTVSLWSLTLKMSRNKTR